MLNHIDATKLNETIKATTRTPEKAKRTMRLEGEWLFNDSEEPQFRPEVQAERKKSVLEADQPTFLGGGGTRPSPVHYCLYGVAACVAATFATLATSKGIELTEGCNRE